MTGTRRRTPGGPPAAGPAQPAAAHHRRPGAARSSAPDRRHGRQPRPPAPRAAASDRRHLLRNGEPARMTSRVSAWRNAKPEPSVTISCNAAHRCRAPATSAPWTPAAGSSSRQSKRRPRTAAAPATVRWRSSSRASRARTVSANLRRDPAQVPGSQQILHQQGQAFGIPYHRRDRVLQRRSGPARTQARAMSRA